MILGVSHLLEKSFCLGWEESVETFNPFGKELRHVVKDDFIRLTTLSEGWYVEYKREVPKAADIAKSVSSFANQYGGWLFYGIESRSGGDNVPVGFPGIADCDWHKYQERIASAVSRDCAPAPYYELRMFEGPIAGIQLPSGRGIIVISVRKGLNAPYVHSSGRIYRRIGDQSDPVSETDRTSLDLLWSRREKALSNYKDFLCRSPELTSAETSCPHLSIYLFSDPMGEKGLNSNITFDTFREVVSSGQGKSFDVVYDNVYSSQDGYIAQLRCKNDPIGFVPTLRHYHHGTTVFSCPVRSEQINGIPGRSSLSKYEHGAEFQKLARSSGADAAEWLDLNVLLVFYVSAIIKHSSLLRGAGLSEDTYCKTRFNSVWRKIPFIDADSYIEYIKQNGFPVLQEGDIWSPPTFRPDAMIKVKLQEGVGLPPEVLGAAGAWGMALGAMGLEGLLREDSVGQILSAVWRGIQAHGADMIAQQQHAADGASRRC